MSRPIFNGILVAALLATGLLSLKTSRQWTIDRNAMTLSNPSLPPTASVATSSETATEQNLRASLAARFKGATLTKSGERFQVNLDGVSVDQVIAQIWTWEQKEGFVVRSFDVSQIKSGFARVELQMSPRVGPIPPSSTSVKHSTQSAP